MVTCPKCGRPVSGRARSCGYCGESLVNEYFSRPAEEEVQDSPITAGAVASMVLGVLGVLALLSALVFRILPLFGFWEPVQTDTGWWVTTLLMTLLPIIYLMMQIPLRGERLSLVPDSVSLFIAVMVLSMTIQIYLMQGITPFDGPHAIPYLLTLGCILVAVASMAGILTFRKSA
ncbi:MAG: zinc ribbon domain-containing protein [Oscillospiraceae bacterium]|nr:zinc ribbon domain-containing protein [Oscillospiraceae bacterium]